MCHIISEPTHLGRDDRERERGGGAVDGRHDEPAARSHERAARGDERGRVAHVLDHLVMAPRRRRALAVSDSRRRRGGDTAATNARAGRARVLDPLERRGADQAVTS